MGTVKDKTGERYGHLTVIHYLGLIRESGQVRAQWLCRCDCGNEIAVTSNTLQRNKHRRRDSCGCKRFKPNNAAALYELYTTYQRSSRDRGIEFSLSRDELTDLSGQRCYYCGREPYAHPRKRWKDFVYNGIDRIDNRLGYISGNCVPCCKECNGAKSKMSAEQFIKLCQLVADYQKERRYD